MNPGKLPNIDYTEADLSVVELLEPKRVKKIGNALRTTLRATMVAAHRDPLLRLTKQSLSNLYTVIFNPAHRQLSCLLGPSLARTPTFS